MQELLEQQAEQLVNKAVAMGVAGNIGRAPQPRFPARPPVAAPVISVMAPVIFRDFPAFARGYCSFASRGPPFTGIYREIRLTRKPALPSSIRRKRVLVVKLEIGVLRVLAQEAVAHGKPVDLGAHEAAEGVSRRKDDRLAAHVEAGVDQNRAAGAL